MNELLDFDTLQKVIEAALHAGLWEPDRRRLLFFRMVDLQARMPNATSHELQLRTDLMTLNPSAPRAGLHPMLIWLQNARPLVAGTSEQDFFEKLVARLEGRPAQPAVPRAAIEALRNEALLFQDDMLPVGYLQAGLAAGRSVARLRIPRFENGAPNSKRYWGTGWLLTDSLLVTNHHVFNARDEGEPPAGDADYLKQTLASTIQFDADSQDSGADPVLPEKLVTTDPNLDYAIVRIARQPGRKPLAIEPKPFQLRPGEVVSLNIIQHPIGQPKRIAIRNNLATACDSPELRYFTSTLGGSSGAPVLNDEWKVVGIHRGSVGTKVLTFQGRDTAIVNLGTQIQAILTALPAELRGEISSAP